ncbi:MAG: metallophosphoesterase [Polaromonas sp.]|uniref:metallophosphoesterase family protein n=1 Tax=Polaromonas sp. TaxID=1869339 RepID=UPI002730AB67|nr:metallophosphoesterase [Polaromonas sp.]MDP2255876.1 metallophosphoesterase [Polaromonas sp.]MDP3708697.1 metallophosphoesterase [Polaromonas sp.]
MTLLLHMSDPHFGTAQQPVLEALVRLAQAQRPDVLVLSGDITQRARASQFKEAQAFCDRLAIARLMALPGNHDIPLFNLYQRLFTPYARYLHAFGPALETCLDTPQLRVVGVNTTRRWRHKNGEVSAAQIDRVVAQLQSAGPAQLRVVVVHQPVYVMRAEDEHDRLRGWEPAVRAWAAAGADLVIGGHIHLPYVCELSSRVAGLGRRLWCVQAGTALSSRVRWEAPNSVNLLRYDAAGDPLQCQLERWDYLSVAGRFELVDVSALLLDRKWS